MAPLPRRTGRGQRRRSCRRRCAAAGVRAQRNPLLIGAVAAVASSVIHKASVDPLAREERHGGAAPAAAAAAAAAASIPSAAVTTAAATRAGHTPKAPSTPRTRRRARLITTVRAVAVAIIEGLEGQLAPRRKGGLASHHARVCRRRHPALVEPRVRATHARRGGFRAVRSTCMRGGAPVEWR